MNAPAPLSRFYLLPTGIAIALGLLALFHHLRQPTFPALPGRGCIVTTIPSPDSLYLPTPYLELNACVHISETILELNYYAAPNGGYAGLFEARVEEDPRRWAKAVGVHWLSVDTIQVTYRPDVQFARRRTSFSGGYVVYTPLP